MSQLLLAVCLHLRLLYNMYLLICEMHYNHFRKFQCSPYHSSSVKFKLSNSLPHLSFRGSAATVGISWSTVHIYRFSQEIATPFGLAMTVVIDAWLHQTESLEKIQAYWGAGG